MADFNDRMTKYRGVSDKGIYRFKPDSPTGPSPTATGSNRVSLQQYLEKVYGEVKPIGGGWKHVPISIILQHKNGAHIYAHKYGDEHHYSGSLLKVVALYAAFKLRKEAKSLADAVNNNIVKLKSNKPANFFDELKKKFNPNHAVHKIRITGGIKREPDYSQILSVTESPKLKVEFHPDFDLLLRAYTDLENAGAIIRLLSYPYINVKLMEDQFFIGSTHDTPNPIGIWLAGDYHQARVVTINTANDAQAKQNTSSREMARLFFMLLERKLVDFESSADMLLIRTNEGRLHSIHFDYEYGKEGLGGIKKDLGGGGIQCEGAIIKWNYLDEETKKKWQDEHNLTGKAIICWLNFPYKSKKEKDGTKKLPDDEGVIEKIITKSISNFINQAPL